MAKVLKYVKARMALVDLIARSKFAPGDKLPREKDLAASFDVSAISIRRAMGELASQGVIESVQGVGTFLCKPISMAASQGTVVFIDIQERRPYVVSPFVSALQMELALRGLDLSFVPAIRPDTNLSGAMDGAAGVFVMGRIDGQWADFLQMLPYPLVVLGSNPYPDRFHTVTYDWQKAGEMLADCFLDRGCRRVGLVNGASDYYPAQRIDQGYRQALERHNLPYDSTAVIWPRPGETRRFLDRYLTEYRPDALVVESGAVFHVLSWNWNHPGAVSAALGIVADHPLANVDDDESGRIVKAAFFDSLITEAVATLHRILHGSLKSIYLAIHPKLSSTADPTGGAPAERSQP